MHPTVAVWGNVVLIKGEKETSCYCVKKALTLKMREHYGTDFQFLLNDGKMPVWFIWDHDSGKHEPYDLENLGKIWSSFGADWKELLAGIPLIKM